MAHFDDMGDMATDPTTQLTPRTERQMRAARIRAARATRTLRSYTNSVAKIDAWQTNVMKYVELSEVCQARSCDKPAVKRIAINCWGCLYEVDVCEGHSDRHGKWVETI